MHFLEDFIPNHPLLVGHNSITAMQYNEFEGRLFQEQVALWVRAAKAGYIAEVLVGPPLREIWTTSRHANGLGPAVIRSSDRMRGRRSLSNRLLKRNFVGNVLMSSILSLPCACHESGVAFLMDQPADCSDCIAVV